MRHSYMLKIPSATVTTMRNRQRPVLRLETNNTSLNLSPGELERLLAELKPNAHYQRAFACGERRVSGSDIGGKYTSSYSHGRQRVIDAVENSGLALIEVRGLRNTKSLWSHAELAEHLNACGPRASQEFLVNACLNDGAEVVMQLIAAGLQVA